MDNFDFYSPTYFAFGDGQETRAGELVRRFGGSRVLIVTGSGSVHRNGAFDAIAASLDKAGSPTPAAARSMRASSCAVGKTWTSC